MLHHQLCARRPQLQSSHLFLLSSLLSRLDYTICFKFDNIVQWTTSDRPTTLPKPNPIRRPIASSSRFSHRNHDSDIVHITTISVPVFHQYHLASPIASSPRLPFARHWPSWSDPLPPPTRPPAHLPHRNPRHRELLEHFVLPDHSVPPHPALSTLALRFPSSTPPTMTLVTRPTMLEEPRLPRSVPCDDSPRTNTTPSQHNHPRLPLHRPETTHGVHMPNNDATLATMIEAHRAHRKVKATPSHRCHGNNWAS